MIGRNADGLFCGPARRGIVNLPAYCNAQYLVVIQYLKIMLCKGVHLLLQYNDMINATKQ